MNGISKFRLFAIIICNLNFLSFNEVCVQYLVFVQHNIDSRYTNVSKVVGKQGHIFHITHNSYSLYCSQIVNYKDKMYNI